MAISGTQSQFQNERVKIKTLQLDGTDLTVTAAEINALASTGLSATELGFLDGVTAGTATASKALVVGASKEIATITSATITTLTAPTIAGATAATGAWTFSANPVLATGIRFDLASATATLVSNAATITEYAARITTESLTTAHTASATFVITKVGVVAGDYAMITMAGGTNTAGVPNITSAICTTDTVTVILKNEALATNAFNGTFIFNLIIFKA